MIKKLTVVITVLAALILAPAAFAEVTSAPATDAELSAAPEPAATPAQDDVSGGNEYSEEVPPTGTGDPDDTPEQTSDDTDDTTTSEPAPTGGGTTSGSDVAATEATETGAEEAGLPRTGAESWIIALIGVALLGCGIVVRRAALSQR
jgi:LPXTG-motif cell wall-anchored protein